MAEKKLTYMSKEFIVCPVCNFKFQKEEMLTGRGRMVAGELTEQLHRKYEETRKYGVAYPLIYFITVCPKCYYAAFPVDFSSVSAKVIPQLKKERDYRFDQVLALFDLVNFEQPRSLIEGAASYLLTLLCYEHFEQKNSPLIRCAVSSLRCAWILNDLHEKETDQNYDYAAKILYTKAAFYYRQAIEMDSKGIEPMDSLANLGPDLDNNFGSDGVFYLSAYLEYKYGNRNDQQLRIKSLERARTTVGKIFGMGRSSKNKPAALLNFARDIHSEIKKELGE